MKTFKYNGVEYIIYAKGEHSKNEFPCIVNSSSGKKPIGAQKTILRKLLEGNGIPVEDKKGTHGFCNIALANNITNTDITGEDVSTRIRCSTTTVNEMLDFLKKYTGCEYASDQSRKDLLATGQINQARSDAIKQINKLGAASTGKLEDIAELIREELSDESFILEKKDDNKFYKQNNSKLPTKSEVRDYLWIQLYEKNHTETPVTISLFAKNDGTEQFLQICLEYDEKKYCNPKEKNPTIKEGNRKNNELYKKEYDEFKKWATNNSMQMSAKINRLSGVNDEEYEEKIIEAAESIKKTYCRYLKIGDNLDMTQTEQIKKLLDDNKQVILTGAPGTGKTYTVREYVKQMTEGKNDHYRFVQFHPSYDYSDFVEGLKPVYDSSTSGSNMFVRLDGRFKEFCRTIVEADILSMYGRLDQASIDNYIDKAKTSTTETTSEVVSTEPQCDKIEENHENIETEPNTNNDCDHKESEPTKNSGEYYFVIDEINRADLSKVFGEIMFCLDEDYRGPENRIHTQYSNLKTYKSDGTVITCDVFAKGFFVPENLHIIGTMNDIDRSVESFDFALRRRFLWKEIDANESIDELDELFKGIDVTELKEKAKKANNLFVDAKYRQLGLTKQFMLGKAYYKDYDGNQNSIKTIFDHKIEPIIREYTRGRNQNLVEELLDQVAQILGCDNKNIKLSTGPVGDANISGTELSESTASPIGEISSEEPLGVAESAVENTEE